MSNKEIRLSKLRTRYAREISIAADEILEPNGSYNDWMALYDKLIAILIEYESDFTLEDED